MDSDKPIPELPVAPCAASWCGFPLYLGGGATRDDADRFGRWWEARRLEAEIDSQRRVAAEIAALSQPVRPWWRRIFS